MTQTNGDGMKEADFLGFVTALGGEFAEVVFAACGKLLPSQDGYEVYHRAFHEDPSPKRLAALTKKDLETLRAASEQHLGKKITSSHMKTWVERTLRRWPAPRTRKSPAKSVKKAAPKKPTKPKRPSRSGVAAGAKKPTKPKRR